MTITINRKVILANTRENNRLSINDVIIKKLEMPFTLNFKHAQASRSQAYGILIQINGSCDIKGYGESCPRPYVTGEDYNTAGSFYHQHLESILEIVRDYPSLLNWVQGNQELIDQNPAAWCALELSLLDLFAKIEGVSVETLMDLPSIKNHTFQYSAVLGSGDLAGFKKQLQLYIRIGFTDFKFKLSGHIQDDQERLALFQSMVQSFPQSHFRLRWDANNLWSHTHQATSYFNTLLPRKQSHPVQYCPFALEEPLKVNQHSKLLTLASSLDLPIILDESFTRYDQFDLLEGSADHWIINVRISKMGGLIRSKAIIDMAKQKGIGVILGAQVGETSLLTRAALAMVKVCGASLKAQEGAFGDLLLKYDITQSSLKFGSKGHLQATTQGNGFGLIMNELMIDQLTLL
ncbi:MAG: enolase C-terminal domain-like protein [Bermanella sp.]